MKHKKEEITEILDLLNVAYPDAGCALIHENVFQLLVKVTLSAQTTDVSVNNISDKLFQAYPDPFQMAKANVSDMEEILRTIGMYKTKSRRLIEQAQMLVEQFNGAVPADDELLQTLPGVGRKTANVVMSVGFGQQRIAVDTHVFRVSNRIGLVKGDDVLKTELALMKVLPNDRWTEAHHSIIFHGRRCCIARGPKCELCPIIHLCRQVGIPKAKKKPAPPKGGVVAIDKAKWETEAEKQVCQALENLEISYDLHHHQPIFTAADAMKVGLLPGFNVKNLVVYDKKADSYYMVVLEDHEKMDMKRMKALTGWSNRVNFADGDLLMGLIGVEPGSCSIFGVLNDKEKRVKVVISGEIGKAGDHQIINFHPNINTATVSITIGDMYKFLKYQGVEVIVEK